MLSIEDSGQFYSRHDLGVLTLPDDGLVPIGSLPVAIEDSPLLELLRDTPGFAEFRQEVARRRAVMQQRVRVMREQLGVAAD